MSASDLPFEVFRKILSYLRLEEILRARAVCRRWCAYIDFFNVPTLFYSQWPKEFIFDQNRLVSSQFATNYIQSLKFDCFFDAYADSIFARLKHLRICDLDAGSNAALFEVLNRSFDQLKRLDLIRIVNCAPAIHFKSASIETLFLEELDGVQQFSVDAPELLNIRIWFVQYSKRFDLRLIKPEKIERLELDFFDNGCLESGKFLNLKYLHTNDMSNITPALLQDLDQLREIHLIFPFAALQELLDQKRAYNRTNLKIFYHGLCLQPNEYRESSRWFNETVAELMIDARHQPNLAQTLPYQTLSFSSIERVFTSVPDALWKRFTSLRKILVPENPQNMQQFREFLVKFDNILELEFHIDGPRCQRLLDQLVDYCPSVQALRIHSDAGLNFDFVLQFKRLTLLSIVYSNGLFEEKLILAIFRELRSLRKLHLNGCNCRLEINTRAPNEFDLKINDQDFLVFGPQDLMQAFRYWSSRLLFFSR